MFFVSCVSYVLCLFFAALWSPAGKELTSWLLLVMFIVFLLLSHVVSWVRFGTRLYRFLIFASFLTMHFHFKCSSSVLSFYPSHFEIE